MSLDLALSIARSGLSHINRQIAQSAGNITNAGTEGYTAKTIAGAALTPTGIGSGVRSLEASREVDAALLSSLYAARGQAAAAAVRERLLERVEAAHGRIDGGDALGDAVAALRNSFVALRESPGEPALQAAAVNQADSVARRINTISSAITAARQEAHDGIVAEVDALNAGLREVARLSAMIQQEVMAGRSAADLEDRRDVAIGKLAEIIDISVVPKDDGTVLLVARGGMVLPQYTDRDAFSVDPASVGPGSHYGAGGTLPGVMLDGVDVTARLTGGRLGEYVRLRDETLPRQQAELDVAAAQIAQRFAAQGLSLFTGPAGDIPDPAAAYNDPAGGALGFAAVIRVNPDVAANPSLIRDGTHAVADDPTGPSAFEPNPPDGPASFSVLLDRVLDFTFGRVQRSPVGGAEVPHPGFATSGLGPDGTLTSNLVTPRTLEEYAALLTSSQTGERAAATAARGQAEAMRAGLEQRVTARSGVDVDKELAAMVVLQNSYAANARVLSTVQQMWDALFGAVR